MSRAQEGPSARPGEAGEAGVVASGALALESGPFSSLRLPWAHLTGPQWELGRRGGRTAEQLRVPGQAALLLQPST